MKEIIKVHHGQVLVDEEALERFIEEIENQINLIENGEIRNGKRKSNGDQ